MAETDNKSDMAQTKESAPIKLFGMTISLQVPQDSSIPTELDVPEKEESELEFDDVKGSTNEVENQHEVSHNDNNLKEEEEEEEKEKEKEEEEEEEEEEGEEKFPKPDKILPCPRCNSLETKFCYFNNYNVNQPRHFCRNCQRYWTAGGTMRNVPIGAGRRKNKLLRIHHETPRRSADSETTHLTPIVNFRGRQTKEEDHATNHVVPIAAPFVYPNRVPSNGIIPLQFVPMPYWVWTFGGNRTLQQPMVGLDNMGLDKNGSSPLGKHSRDDFSEEKMMGEQRRMIGFKTPRRTDEPGKNS